MNTIDVWHVSKSKSFFAYHCIYHWNKEKLACLSTDKDCLIIAKWIESITNHLYWCVASAPDDDSDDIIKHWKSLMEHIIDMHDECCISCQSEP